MAEFYRQPPGRHKLPIATVKAMLEEKLGHALTDELLLQVISETPEVADCIDLSRERQPPTSDPITAERGESSFRPHRSTDVERQFGDRALQTDKDITIGATPTQIRATSMGNRGVSEK